MKRYDLEWVGAPFNQHQKLVEADEGDWVLHADAAAELARVRGEREWRSMDSAPRDGTYVMLAADFAGEIGVAVGYASARDDWWEIGLGVIDPHPVAWQPLPAPPKPGEVGNGMADELDAEPPEEAGHG